MYLGQIVEVAPAMELFADPIHPYTRALCAAAPLPDPSLRSRPSILLKGEIGSAIDPPAGCRFAPRCPYATDACRARRPELAAAAPGGSHFVACPVALAGGAGREAR
jgi:oligopeptide/dipeptide ABC transporter ATP-binding protein